MALNHLDPHCPEKITLPRFTSYRQYGWPSRHGRFLYYCILWTIVERYGWTHTWTSDQTPSICMCTCETIRDSPDLPLWRLAAWTLPMGFSSPLADDLDSSALCSNVPGRHSSLSFQYKRVDTYIFSRKAIIHWSYVHNLHRNIGYIIRIYSRDFKL